MKSKFDPGKSSWKSKSSGLASALAATLVTLGGVALLFASATGELDELTARFQAMPSWAVALILAPSHG